jgi:hypothetical protein
MAENDLSIRIADINTRALAIITAPDDPTKDAANDYLRKLADGELSAIQTNKALSGMESIETQPYANGSNLSVSMTSLIELQQYLKAGWNNDVGLNANYNMKRESLNSNESQLNEDALLPTPADMLEQRRIALDKINEMFGLNIKVDLSSAWKKHEATAEAIVENLDDDGETVDSVEDNLSSEPETASEETESTAEESETVPEDETEETETSEETDEESSETSENSADGVEEKIDELKEDESDEEKDN